MYRKNSFSESEHDNSFVKFTEKEQNQSSNMTFLESFWLACKRSTPTILTMIFFQMVQLSNIIYVG